MGHDMVRETVQTAGEALYVDSKCLHIALEFGELTTVVLDDAKDAIQCEREVIELLICAPLVGAHRPFPSVIDTAVVTVSVPGVTTPPGRGTPTRRPSTGSG